MDRRLLGIYLNDHFAGASAGLELARRTASAQGGSSVGAQLHQVVGELEEDLAALGEIMTSLDIPVRRARARVARLAEKVGRLKFNGRLRSRSPLSDLVELEGLALATAGKLACWGTLRQLSQHELGLESARLDTLLGRARRQAEVFARLRDEAVGGAFTASEERRRTGA